MKKTKRAWEKAWAVLLSCLMLLFMNCGTLAAAPAENANTGSVKEAAVKTGNTEPDRVKGDNAKAGAVKAEDTKTVAAKTDNAKTEKAKPAEAGKAKKGKARAGNAKYSVDAPEIEYDMDSGDGTTTGKTIIKYDGGTAVGQKGSTFNSKKRTGHLYGGVVADKEDEHLKSEELFIYSDKYYSAVGDAVVKKADKTLIAPRVDYHDDTKFAETMGGTARLEATDGSWMTAGKITYDMNAGMANATGGVKLASPPRKLTGSGDTAIYNTKETGYIDLIGNATATQDGNTVKGDKLRITNTSPNHNRTHARETWNSCLHPGMKTHRRTILLSGKERYCWQTAGRTLIRLRILWTA